MEEEDDRRGEEAREGVRRNVDWRVTVSGRGVARVVPKLVVWGRKPLSNGDGGKDR